MKRIFSLLLLIVTCAALLCLPVSAASSVTSAHSGAVVEQDGSCRVEISFQITLEQAQTPEFPLPKDARNVRLDGTLKTPTAQGERRMLSLGTRGAGIHSFCVSFELSDTVTKSGDTLTAQIPLLTGFAYPLEAFSFTVTLPGTPAKTPTLSSNWGEEASSLFDVRVSGNTVTATATGKLLDSTQLSLICTDDGTLFPRYRADTDAPDLWRMIALTLIAVGILYYLIALTPSFPRKVRSFSPPEGLAAGDVGTCLTGCGMDLTMMVFSWAELGYLSVVADADGRVVLQKRMDMGSERSDFENHAFERLFSGRRTVDGSSLHYALLCRKMATKSPLLRQIYRSRSGNPEIVRVLATAVAACGGVMLSQGVYTAGAATYLLAFALAAACAVLSRPIRSGGRCVPLGNKAPIRIGLACAAAWLILGYLCGNVQLAALLVLYETLVGVATAVGGRRSEIGRQYLAQIRGLRAQLTRGSVFAIRQCLARNPSYFFEMMPYALALGVEKRFARRFGKVRIAQCDYVTTDRENLTPMQWAALLRQIADRLDRRQRRLKWENLLRRHTRQR